MDISLESARTRALVSSVTGGAPRQPDRAAVTASAIARRPRSGLGVVLAGALVLAACQSGAGGGGTATGGAAATGTGGGQGSGSGGAGTGGAGTGGGGTSTGSGGDTGAGSGGVGGSGGTTSGTGGSASGTGGSATGTGGAGSGTGGAGGGAGGSSGDGPVIPVSGGMLKIQVCADDIIRVAFAKDAAFFTRSTLATAPKRCQTPAFTTTTASGTTTITTAKLQVRVDTATGAVTFLDASGQTVLAEKSGGRTMTSATVGGEATSNIRQEWMPNEDESLYGLGQHQHGLLDIKDYDFTCTSTTPRSSSRSWCRVAVTASCGTTPRSRSSAIWRCRCLAGRAGLYARVARRATSTRATAPSLVRNVTPPRRGYTVPAPISAGSISCRSITRLSSITGARDGCPARTSRAFS